MNIESAIEKAEDQAVYAYRLRKRAKEDVEELKLIFENWDKISPKFVKEPKHTLSEEDKKGLIWALLKSLSHRTREEFFSDFIVKEVQKAQRIVEEGKGYVDSEWERPILGLLRSVRNLKDGNDPT